MATNTPLSWSSSLLFLTQPFTLVATIHTHYNYLLLLHLILPHPLLPHPLPPHLLLLYLLYSTDLNN
ncbi:hypothetical protein QR685DRAFT_194434 [Neurospora intermedia]|uniref:Uncharacterized protein n=1 Tax=Neurospora intermedia TaxID=5142 RepID=A0ABR3DP29_NEUIN